MGCDGGREGRPGIQMSPIPSGARAALSLRYGRVPRVCGLRGGYLETCPEPEFGRTSARAPWCVWNVTDVKQPGRAEGQGRPERLLEQR